MSGGITGSRATTSSCGFLGEWLKLLTAEVPVHVISQEQQHSPLPIASLHDSINTTRLTTTGRTRAASAEPPDHMSNTRRGILSLFVHLSLLRTARPHGPSPAPAPAAECAVALQSLSRCSTYVEAGSNLSRPQKGCCRALAAVAGGDPVCLCGLIDDYRGFGVRVDTTRALMLPSTCRAPPAPASLCAVVGMPVATALPPSEEPGTGCCAPGAPAAAAPPSKNGGCRLTTMVWCDLRYAFCLALLLLSYSFPSL